MTRQLQEPTWPFLCILIFLFILSAAAPRAWHSKPGPAAGPAAEHQTASNDIDIIARAAEPTGPILVPHQTIEQPSGMLAVVPSHRYAEDHYGLDWDELEVANESEAQLPLLLGSEFIQQDAPLNQSEATPPEWVENHGVEGISAIQPEEIARLAAGRRHVDPRGELLAGSLLEALETLSWDCRSGDWARDTARTLRRLAVATSESDGMTPGLLGKLEQLDRSAAHLAASLAGDPVGAEVAKVRQMIRWRLELWKLVHAASLAEPVWSERADRVPLKRCLAALNALTRGSEEGVRWRGFLALDSVALLASGNSTTWTPEDRLLARLLLARLDTATWSESQRAFALQGPIAELPIHLEAIAAEPIDVGEILQAIESYGRTGSPVAARAIGVERLKLSCSGEPAYHRLGYHLTAVYGNPNVRIVVTKYLLNRMIPDRQPEYQWVRDTVMGKPVCGESRTDTRVSVELIPNPRRLMMALKIDGSVSARTYTTSGPATVFNDSSSTYSAVKNMELSTGGLRLEPAEVTTDSHMRLRAIRTLFDPIPLLGSMVQEVARSEHERVRSQVRREVKQKVYRQAKLQVDAEVDSRLDELSQRLGARLLNPLATMSVGPTMVESKTTENRMTMQLRVASVLQLGSHMQRPWAPSDSVLSCQVHQSAMNNVLQQLELDGATLTIAQLRERIAERFDRPEMLDQTTENDDVKITFAQRDAVRVELRDGHFTIALAVRQLRKGARCWRNFEVLVSYRPRITGRTAEFARDGVVRLRGRLNAGSQIALRGIFSKTFPKDRTWPVVPRQLAQDPRLARVCVTQFVVHDGWIALAMGPHRPQPAIAGRPRAVVE